MKNKIRVTIGMCVKNCEATINDAINSVLSQDFPHELMEIIVVDGFSKDKTLHIIKDKLAKSDIKYRIFKENIGLGAARQIVVENANGDYIIWVDGDIILSPSYVRRQVEFMDKNPHVGIAEGRYGIRREGSLVADLENVVAAVHSSPNISNIGSLAATEGAIWRVKAIREVGGFDVNIKGAAEDGEVSYRIKAAGWSIRVTNEVFQEICRRTWKALWDQYFWYGYGSHYMHHKKRGMLKLYKMIPLAGFFAGLLYSFDAYRLTRRKIVFLLPIHYSFKRIAWVCGFIKGHIDKYGH
ncbi:MAG: glycosyltransferase [Candidatus Aenigmatarchaeota archaeon]